MSDPMLPHPGVIPLRVPGLGRPIHLHKARIRRQSVFSLRHVTDAVDAGVPVVIRLMLCEAIADPRLIAAAEASATSRRNGLRSLELRPHMRSRTGRHEIDSATEAELAAPVPERTPA